MTKPSIYDSGMCKNLLAITPQNQSHGVILTELRSQTEYRESIQDMTQKALCLPISSSKDHPILNYQLADDIILGQLAFRPDGFLSQPIFDYQVIKQ